MPRMTVGLLVWMLAMVVVCEGKGDLTSQPLEPGNANTIPAYPVTQQQQDKQTCHLDLSDEMFGGVKEACSVQGKDNQALDRSRCCPVLAAWFYAAHARSALTPATPLQMSAPAPSPSNKGNGSSVIMPWSESEEKPAVPEDSQVCVSSLHRSLEGRGIKIAGPNSTCDIFLCYCGIRLHTLSSLTCPNAFNVSSEKGNRSVAHSHYHSRSLYPLPLPAIRALESNCTAPSYAGCSRCLSSLQKVKGKSVGGEKGRSAEMYKRDCQIMGLTWLLSKNKTVFIPTVSAVLRALVYSDTDAHSHSHAQCSRDKDNMPLAVDSMELHPESSSSMASSPLSILVILLSLYLVSAI